MDWSRLLVVFSHALLVLSSAVSPFAQQKTEASQTTPQSPGVVSTGGAHAPVLDNEKRPITAGGFVDSGPIVLQDISEKAGLTRWRHVMGTPEAKFILETVGSGVALLDYDNDGWLDIYVVNGSTYDALSGKASPPRRPLS
jgi:enediyne biosynthesis protein E4